MRTLILILALVVSFEVATGQTFTSYYSTADLSLASPGAMKSGLSGLANPALLTYVRQADLQFAWTDATGSWNDFNRWGLFVAAPNLGFEAVKTKAGTASITDYKLSVGFGDRTVGFGVGYGFSGGDKAAFDRTNVWTLGALVRPDPHASVGLIGSAATSGGRTEAAVELGARPLGDEVLTLFADYAIQNGYTLGEGAWSAGAVIEALPGIRLTGRIFDTHDFSLGLSISLGHAELSAQSSFDRDSKHTFNTYAIRLGAYDRTVIEKLTRRSKYVEMNLYGDMKYQRYVLFDNGQTLRRTLDAIGAAKDDETVAGIAINTSGMNINREMLWELREALKAFREVGKKVVVFIDRPSLEAYRLATVADKIVLDPSGMILLPGYVAGGTYLKGTLEKLGIGFDEWRFFKYKSADEFLSRESMSAADREQKQKFIDDLYASTKADICEGRRLGPAQFDSLINNETLFLPHDAVEKGLVDTVGRWEGVRAMVERLEGEKKATMGPGGLARFNLPFDSRWSEPPRIAVVYALGECAMDAGIRARTLVKDVESAANDSRIKAIVLRVDSPGGDGMASDYIAEAVKRAKEKKPVIVSQGYVAGSGGYWLSMYADTIVAAPGTITGSIGVIGGWIYNKDLKEKLGMSTDHVQVGQHADIDFGFRLPFLGVGIPDRNLTGAERTKVERAIKTAYADFVGKVAVGRKTTPEKIEQIAQGRFYSGVEGKRLGLVDILGGLDDAIRVARLKAHLDEHEDITIVELPKPGLFDFSRLIPNPLGFEQTISSDPAVEYLRFRLQHNGQPVPVMPLDELDAWPPGE